MDDYSAFVTTKWKELSFDQRREALQKLENQLASDQGRQPGTVQAAPMEEGTRGQYDPLDPENIRIKHALLKSDRGN